MKNPGMRTLVCIICVIAIGVCGIIIAKELRGNMSKEPVGIGVTIDPDSGTFVEPEKDETEEDEKTPGIAIPGWGSINLDADKTEVDVNLMNPEDNADKYNLSFTITIKGEDEPIAKTGLIKAGESALKLKLSRALEAGEYEATVLVQPYRVEDNSTTNNAEIDTVLVVK